MPSASPFMAPKTTILEEGTKGGIKDVDFRFDFSMVRSPNKTTHDLGKGPRKRASFIASL